MSHLQIAGALLEQRPLAQKARADGRIVPPARPGSFSSLSVQPPRIVQRAAELLHPRGRLKIQQRPGRVYAAFPPPSVNPAYVEAVSVKTQILSQEMQI
ncbi:MAG: hypothetical protein MMC33_009993 [Icmadophila ericetorum]|jgi:hypothetical protein|nr:hypothetical protein [Icmadophila ericetorum]